MSSTGQLLQLQAEKIVVSGSAGLSNNQILGNGKLLSNSSFETLRGGDFERRKQLTIH